LETPEKHYWQIRLAHLKGALEANNFEVFIAEGSAEAREIVLKHILPGTGARRISRGGSVTFFSTGLYEAIRENTELEFVEPFDEDLSSEERLARLRQSLLVDLFITGTNAVTETGKLVNLDMVGNRAGAITFGPEYVVILVGRNKIVRDVEEAMWRIKNYVAPVNAMRLDQGTPCAKTSYCNECRGPERICNTWTITEKSYPKGRVKVVLVNEDLGL